MLVGNGVGPKFMSEQYFLVREDKQQHTVAFIINFFPDRLLKAE